MTYPCTVKLLDLHCGQLVFFSRVNFAKHMKSQVRQWGPWKATNGKDGPEIALNVSETYLSPLGLSGPIGYSWLL